MIKQIGKIILGITLYILGILLLIVVFTLPNNIFKAIINLLHAQERGFGWYDYSYNITGVILNILLFLLARFLFKKGSVIIFEKNKEPKS